MAIGYISTRRLATGTWHPVANSRRSEERVLPFIIMNLQQMPDCLGKGTFAIVHKATWLGVEVAKKTFYGPTIDDFFREVSILDGLNHPNIVSLLWSMTDGKRCHFVMELMDGDLFTLMHQRVEENGNQGSPFNIPEALDLILQIGERMLYLHEKRIVHRDLKSHNILIRCGKMAKPNVKYLQVKVADFGLSKTKQKNATYSDMSLNVGTTRWMAPEMMKVGNVRSDDVDGESEATLHYPFKIDIYSFAMVCYEILTGEVPFSSLSHGEVKKAVLSGDRPLLPRECPYRLKTLIESCWSDEASMRPSFASICEELRDLKYANLQICFCNFLADWKATICQCPLEDIATIDELVANLSSPIVEVQQSASNDIRLLTKKSLDHRIYIKEQEVVLCCSRDLKIWERTISKLQALSVDDKNSVIQMNSLEELSLWCNHNSRGSLSKEDYLGSVIGPIVEVLKSSCMKDRENAVQALMKLSLVFGFQFINRIRYFGVVPALLTLLQDKTTQRKEFVGIALCLISDSKVDLEGAIQVGIVPTLINLIAQLSDGAVLDNALKILVKLIKVYEGLIAIAEVKPISTLVKVIALDSRKNIKAHAVGILRRLCLHDPQFIREARVSNVVEHLTVLMDYGASSFYDTRQARSLVHLMQKPEVDDLQM